jgi:hypothetical protein
MVGNMVFDQWLKLSSVTENWGCRTTASVVGRGINVGVIRYDCDRILSARIDDWMAHRSIRCYLNARNRVNIYAKRDYVCYKIGTGSGSPDIV